MEKLDLYERLGVDKQADDKALKVRDTAYMYGARTIAEGNMSNTLRPYTIEGISSDTLNPYTIEGIS